MGVYEEFFEKNLTNEIIEQATNSYNEVHSIYIDQIAMRKAVEKSINALVANKAIITKYDAIAEYANAELMDDYSAVVEELAECRKLLSKRAQLKEYRKLFGKDMPFYCIEKDLLNQRIEKIIGE